MRPSSYRWVMKICFVSALGIIVNLSAAMAADYFVATSGNDGNRGTIGAPFRTLDRGVSVLIPGDTLFVRGGTYRSSPWFSNKLRGSSWTQPITLKAYNEEKVVILANPGQTVLIVKDAEYVIFDGFTFDGKGGHVGIRGDRSHHIRILNGEVMNAPSQGILLAGSTEYFEMINLRIHDNGTTAFDHGIYITTDHHLVKDCSIYNNLGWGVHIYSGAKYKPNFNLVTNNKIYDNARLGRGAGIGIYSGTGNMAINNLVWGNQEGIIVDYGASNASVYNNTIYKQRYGIYLGNSSRDSKVMNNVISSSYTYGLLIGKSNRNSQIKNNLIYGSGAGDLVNQSNTTTLSKNLTGGNYNPQFQNPGTFDFHLKSGSPAIDSGLEISEVEYDFNYTPRPKAFSHDLGAYEKS